VVESYTLGALHHICVVTGKVRAGPAIVDGRRCG
jgi:hypothetical protein